jgi:hypothetical protein
MRLLPEEMVEEGRGSGVAPAADTVVAAQRHSLTPVVVKPSAARRHSIIRQESFQMNTARLQSTKDIERIRQEVKLEDRKLSRLKGEQTGRTPRAGEQAFLFSNVGIKAKGPLPALRAPEVSSDEELGSLSTDSEDASPQPRRSPAGPSQSMKPTAGFTLQGSPGASYASNTGLYIQMEGLFVNSRPIYHHETRDKALYLNNDERWIIGSKAGAKLGDTKGHLYVKDLAHAATAAELDSRQWKCFDSAKKTWVIDPAIRVIPKPGVAPLKGVLAASPNVAPQKGARASVLIPQKIALAALPNVDRKEDSNKNASAARRHSIMRQESFQMKTARLQATKDTERIRQEAKLEDRKLSRLNTRTPRGGTQMGAGEQDIQAPLPALRAPEVSSDEELGSLS